MKKLINYDFCSKIIASFQDYDNVYLVINYYEGKNLFKYKDEIMSENEIKFITACIIQSLSDLREENIIHRDVSMKNLIIDKDKYINLIDFSFSIKYSEKENNKLNFKGCRLESAPEMQKGLSYDYNSDYYRIGVIIYYLLFKRYIYDVKKEKNINEMIIDYKTIKNYSLYCIDFLNKLIINDYKKRIGLKNINELKFHSWFKGFNWENLKKRRIISPLRIIKTKDIKKKCKKFYKYKKFKKNKYYKYYIKNYDFINEKITIKIFNSFKKYI